jgi:hypothetical protein
LALTDPKAVISAASCSESFEQEQTEGTETTRDFFSPPRRKTAPPVFSADVAFSPASTIRGRRVGREDVFLDGVSLDQVLLDDAFENVRGAGVIPDSIGINHGHRSPATNAKTVDLAPVNLPFRAGQIEFRQPPFQKSPGLQARFPGTAFRLSLVRAEEDVPLVTLEAEFLNCGLEVLIRFGHLLEGRLRI